MSILSDLDPKNSRIHSAANATANSHFKWTIGLLLMLGGAAWLYLMGTDKLTAVSRTNEGGTVLSSAAQTLAPPVPHLSAPADQGLNHASNAVGAAVIQNVAPRNPAETQDLPLPKPATPRGRETTAALPVGDSSPTETGKPLPSTTQISPHSDRARTSQPTAKAKTTRNRKLAQAQRQQKNASMAAERDIEIISAIVR